MSIAEKLVTIAENEQKVYEAGQKAEYDRFWNSCQNNGERNNYNFAFAGVCWNDKAYKPKYPIVATENAANMFTNSSNIISTKVPIFIDTSNSSSVFQRCTKLTEIPEITVTEKVIFDYWFYRDSVLETINFTEESVIANNISFSECSLLTHDSLMSIINALKDFSGTTTTRTLTLHANSKALLTDTEKAIATQKGWTIA